MRKVWVAATVLRRQGGRQACRDIRVTREQRWGTLRDSKVRSSTSLKRLLSIKTYIIVLILGMAFGIPYCFPRIPVLVLVLGAGEIRHHGRRLHLNSHLMQVVQMFSFYTFLGCAVWSSPL